MNQNNKNGLIMTIIVIVILAAIFSGGGGSSSRSSGNTTYKCNICGRTISSSQYHRTNGFCRSCADMLWERSQRNKGN